MKIFNDNSCGWIDYNNQRSNIKKLDNDLSCDYLIVGAGFTGLSAARKLGQIVKDKKIILIDALLAGEGASSRNSGYLVDTTLNDGFTSNNDVSNYKKKAQIYSSWGISKGKPVYTKNTRAIIIIQIPLRPEKHCELVLVWVRIFQKEWNILDKKMRKILLENNSNTPD